MAHSYEHCAHSHSAIAGDDILNAGIAAIFDEAWKIPESTRSLRTGPDHAVTSKSGFHVCACSAGFLKPTLKRGDK